MTLKCWKLSAGIGGAMILGSNVQAVYVGLGVELHTTVVINGSARDVFRVYALFSDPTDHVFSFGAGSSTDPMVVKNVLYDGSTAGSGFYNAPLGGTFAPDAYSISLAAATQWDSFFTIGPWIQEEAAPETYSVSGVGLPAGNQPSGNAFTAVGAVLGLDLDSGLLPAYTAAGPDHKVGLMQLTVNSGQYAIGTVSIVWNANGGQNQLVMNQIFPLIPGPGTVALLGVAGLFRTRRRRTA